MVSPFTLAKVLPLVCAQAQAYLDAQIVDRDEPDCGALRRADWGLADPGGTASLLALCMWTHGLRSRHPDLVPVHPTDALLAERATVALDYVEHAQRPSGLTDLLDCNFDSSPDAGFILQALCPALDMGRRAGPEGPWASIQRRAEGFARRMLAGMLAGGFHTPNHRWVIASAAVQAAALFPDVDVKPTVDAYLAEGFDVNADGAWTERSAAVYDGICDRSLLRLSELFRCPAAREAACANLHLDLHLLNADGTIETGLSRRQDHNTRAVPGGLIVPYLLAGITGRNPVFVRAAEELWNCDRGTHRDPYGVSQVLVAQGEPPASTAKLPDDFSRLFDASGLWRVRRGPFSASALAGGTRLLAARFGEAELSSLKISQSYFGVGRFVADRTEEAAGGVRLVSEGAQEPYRPGYEMPLGRPVASDQWWETKAEREIRRLPLAVSELLVTEAPGGLDLGYRTLDGMAGVPAQMALDFPPGGTWQTADCCLRPQAGQVLFLRRGCGEMRYGRDAIQIGPGADSHRMWQMRDAEPAPGLVRVLITFRTPVDHTVRLRTTRGVP